jgi:hypothetical protein
MLPTSEKKFEFAYGWARALPWNDPVRYQLLLMAQDFQLCEIELERHFTGSMSDDAE